jgi:hypothetical protein
MAYLSIEPLAQDRDDLRGALHTAFLADRLSLADEPSDVGKLILDWLELSEPTAEAEPADPVAEADALILAINARFGHTGQTT